MIEDADFMLLASQEGRLVDHVAEVIGFTGAGGTGPQKPVGAGGYDRSRPRLPAG